jgi:hypothetical protein
VPGTSTRVDFTGKPAGQYQYTLAACANAQAGNCGGTAGPLTVQVGP